MVFTRFAAPVAVSVLLAVAVAGPASGQTSRVAPPVFDQLASPFTESEIGGIGCAVASLGAGAGMLGLMGGPAAITAGAGVLTPRGVLEASAALAFVFSSACYVGQAMAPVVMMGLTSLLDSLSSPPAVPTPFPAPPNGNLSWLPGAGQQGSAPTAAPLP